MALKKVSYGTTRIQALRRVALDQNLLDTLGLEIGDSVRVELDTEREAILITRESVGDAKQKETITRRIRANR